MLFTSREIDAVVPTTARGRKRVADARRAVETTDPSDNDGEALLAMQEVLYGELLAERCRQEYLRILNIAVSKGWQAAEFTKRVQYAMRVRNVAKGPEAYVGHARAVLEGRILGF